MVPLQGAAPLINWLIWPLALGWLWLAVAALRGMPRLPDLTRMAPDWLPRLPDLPGPHLTVVVPACNEEAAIGATLRSLLASEGLRLQIVAVDDRSTDRTGERMEAIGAEAAAQPAGRHSIQVIRNRELPPGWLGKPHALQLGVEVAAAPWILFTDGDVLFAPSALDLALRLAVASQVDHLVVVPTLIRAGWGEAAVQAAAQALAQWAIRVWKVADPRARDYLGMGGFNLIRAEVLAGLGGVATLRMEVLEDMSLGWLVKQCGFRSSVAAAPGLVSIRWIRGFFGIVGNIEKNGFAGCRYNLPLALAACAGLAYDALVPVAALAAGSWAAAGSLLTFVAIALVYRANRRISGISPWAVMLFPAAAGILGFALLRSVVLTLVRDGVTWRGAHYPLAELRLSAARLRRTPGDKRAGQGNG